MPEITNNGPYALVRAIKGPLKPEGIDPKYIVHVEKPQREFLRRDDGGSLLDYTYPTPEIRKVLVTIRPTGATKMPPMFLCDPGEHNGTQLQHFAERVFQAGLKAGLDPDVRVLLSYDANVTAYLDAPPDEKVGLGSTPAE